MVEEMICPKCKKANLQKEINLGGIIFKRKKKIIFYCPLCNFKSTKIFDLNEAEYQKLINGEDTEW